MSLETGWPERSGKEIAGSETYARHSQELDSVSERYSIK